MNDHDLTHIGDHYGLGHDARRPFGITRADRRQGLHLLGQSGTGKSALMLRMLCQDIMAGEGVTLIDPHGLTARKLLDHIPPERVKDVCYFNVADTERPVPFNILDARLPPEKQHLVVSAVVAAFCGIWNLTPERAPRLLNILKFGVAALLDRVARIGVAGVGGHRRHNRLDKASGVAHKDRAGVGRDRDHGRRRMALALAVGEVTAWASGPAPASQARCVCAP